MNRNNEMELRIKVSTSVPIYNCIIIREEKTKKQRSLLEEEVVNCVTYSRNQRVKFEKMLVGQYDIEQRFSTRCDF